MPDPASTVLPQDQYMVPQAEEMRRKMAMALMQGSGQEPKENMTHPAQLFGNLANRAVGNSMFNSANEFGRKSDEHDSKTLLDNLWGAQRQPGVPFAPPAPGVNYNPNGPQTPSGLGMPGGMGNVSPQRSAQAPPWQDPGMRPSPDMPPGAPVRFTGGPNSGGGPLGTPPPPTGPGGIPNEGGITGGLGYNIYSWPGMGQ